MKFKLSFLTPTIKYKSQTILVEPLFNYFLIQFQNHLGTK